ncbi:MAG TPA: PilN domain-containing protein [Telluria sp.]
MSQQINLFNPVFLKQRKVFTALAMAQALGVLLAGIAVLAWYSGRSVEQLQAQADQSTRQLESRQARLRAATAEMKPKVRSLELEAQLVQRELELKALRDASDVLARGAIGNTRGYSDYFRALARQDTPGLWLTGVSIEGAGVGISIDGRATDAALVPGYIGQLSRETALKGKAFASLEITTPTEPASPAAAAGKAVAVPYVEFRLLAKPGSGG